MSPYIVYIASSDISLISALRAVKSLTSLSLDRSFWSPINHTSESVIYYRTCSFPGAISKGEVSPAQSEYSTGVTVTYSCQTGYTLQGSRTRTCQSNGQWSGFLPICQSKSFWRNVYKVTQVLVKSCGNPGAPAYGTLHGSSYEFGRSVLFKCNTGYVLIGEVTLTCGANGDWDHAKPKCQSKLTWQMKVGALYVFDACSCWVPCPDNPKQWNCEYTKKNLPKYRHIQLRYWPCCTRQFKPQVPG
jgi:hypothetical protein